MPKRVGRIGLLLIAIVGVWWLNNWFAQDKSILINTGVSFGWLGGRGVTIVVGLLLVGLSGWWVKTGKYPLGVMCVGGWVNWIDRLSFGGVRDYWQLPGVGIYNNLSDWVVFIGIIWVIWEALHQR